MRRRLATALLVAAALPWAGSPAVAHDDDHGQELDFTQAPKDTLPWGMLAKVGLRRAEGKLVRNFLPPVRALAGKRITLYGYATAVKDSADPHSLFLLSSQRIVCHGCATPVEPEGIVEINMARPFKLKQRLRHSDVMAIKGKLELIEDDAKSVLYRLTDSVTVDVPVGRRGKG
jgi:hypothetical protein